MARSRRSGETVATQPPSGPTEPIYATLIPARSIAYTQSIEALSSYIGGTRKSASYCGDSTMKGYGRVMVKTMHGTVQLATSYLAKGMVPLHQPVKVEKVAK